jgi:hypothetical protein
VDSAGQTRVLHALEASIFAPAMKPFEESLGPVGSTVFASVLQRCFDAGDA